MDYKQDKINLFLYEIQSLVEKEELTEEKVYTDLINYKIAKENIYNIISEILYKYKKNKKIKIIESNDDYVIELLNNDNININYKLKINIPLLKEEISKNLSKIINYLIKNKINFIFRFSKILKIDSFVIEVTNTKDAEKIITFINNNQGIMNNKYEINPLLPNEEKVFFTIGNNLSYIDILSKYIYRYIDLCTKQKKSSNIIDFEKYVYSKYVELTSKNDLSEQLKMINNSKKNKENLKELEDITRLISNTLKSIINNLNSKETFYKIYEEINSKENDLDKYKDFSEENFNKDNELLKEIIISMSYKYGYDHTKQALINYKEDINNGIDYIMRKNNLREKVKHSKTFRTYINSYSKEELETIFERIKPELTKDNKEKVKTTKEMILEEVCKETYLSCETQERDFTGKKQVAIALIRMSRNDYSLITRNNNARKLAKENLKPEEIVEIIKKTLETNGYILENEIDLYELYVTHIENISNIKKVGEEIVK